MSQTKEQDTTAVAVVGGAATTYRRPVDHKATLEAREQQAAGVARLNAMFGFSPEDFAGWDKSRHDSFPAATRRERRHAAKAARKARRRNRP